ncbi:Glycosyltransferase, catalytic subunit of cellulose synthase and poly-beta-1,6-N-acetylglucosamine synthase [Devosia enhydra]|uniref:Glycosyltransferase, catalytic subunit of cellulose synthase and poly-beta-1,6-N-acetylglucosamine synthase n=1 Tax=Devosia enhydra TaxID=665118 RepID=A0A1K2I1M9_9HYPH|nr:glycosyltransferase family 2 protein [Devosia enhydra]SFZ86285.1 Glycosyltransferase, catalytic subunit of cellulose synthase and poly-beta-1,6-N-acetylglucosamine synthase [Devosia enhydra]
MLKFLDQTGSVSDAERVELLLAIAPHLATTDAALAVLADARRLGVDPIDHLAHRAGISHEDAHGRAAHWAGLTFFPAVPPIPEGAPVTLPGLDSLADVRIIGTKLYDRDVSYMAPRFDGFVILRRACARSPDVFRHTCLVPPGALQNRLVAVGGETLLSEARCRLSRRWPEASADFVLTLRARILFVLALVLLAGLVAALPLVYAPLALPLLCLILLVPALFRLYAVLAPVAPGPEPQGMADADLPVYSVLIPLRDEAHMVPLLYEAMSEIDYPPEKLDITFVVETTSRSTIAAVEAGLGDPRFGLVLVPDAEPLTKPKALNYALPLARGTLLVVYDAEDIPDRDQLRRAAALFAADPGLDCLQAELVIDNAAENPLTALFSGEYAGQFGFVLPLLARLRLPMPLGGTSNHFRVRSLRELGGWDAYNVTEDADLGVRMARLRYRTATFSARTGEEAPIRLGAWMNQRTRWLKGWMQTFIVHNRRPKAFLGDIGWTGFVAFQLYVGSMMFSALLHTLFFVSALMGLATGRLSLAPTDGWGLAMLAVAATGYGAALIVAMVGLWRLGQRGVIGWQLLLPIYWLLHSWAALRAALELLTRPYFWAKTSHGQSRLRQERQ